MIDGRTFQWAAHGIVLALLLMARGVAGEPLEPPPEAPENEDYSVELPDSLEDGRVEVSLGASGSSGQQPRRSRRMRFSGDSLDATVRDGDGDPLSGGVLGGRAGRGAFGVGKLSLRWGRGLVFGSPAEPWSFAAADRGAGAALRGRSGEGAWLEHGQALRTRVLYGRFAKRRLAALSVMAGSASMGTLVDEGGRAQSSLAIERGGGSSEWAFDRAGGWRAEGSMAGQQGPIHWSGRVRAGHQSFRSLAEPKRSGPAHALAVTAGRPIGAWRVDAQGALWRFRPMVAGARGALELAWRDDERGSLAVGLEEQHGTRRDAQDGRPARSGFRQGWWVDWSGQARATRLGVRHESWGARSWARDPVRVVTAARVESRAPLGILVRVTHAVYVARRGESVYLPEAQSDRLVLRALSGAGDRTRVEIVLPAGGGALHAGAELGGALGPRAAAALEPRMDPPVADQARPVSVTIDAERLPVERLDLAPRRVAGRRPGMQVIWRTVVDGHTVSELVGAVEVHGRRAVVALERRTLPQDDAGVGAPGAGRRVFHEDRGWCGS